MKTPTTISNPPPRPDLSDPVLEEVYRTKVKLLERFNYDLQAIARDARSRQAQSGHPVITLSEVSSEPARGSQG